MNDAPTYAGSPSMRSQGVTQDAPTYAGSPSMHSQGIMNDAPTYAGSPSMHSQGVMNDAPTLAANILLKDGDPEERSRLTKHARTFHNSIDVFITIS
jgi:hypothetical protein